MSDEMTETVVETITENEPVDTVDVETQDTPAEEAVQDGPTEEIAEDVMAVEATEDVMAVENTEDVMAVETTEEAATEDAPLDVPAESNGLAHLERKSKLQGKVSRLELYGAFIDVGLDTEALIHISQLGTDHVNRVSDALNVGDEVTVWVDKVDPKRNQLMVTMIEPLAVDWNDLKTGNEYSGNVARLENYGAFIDIGAEREGLVHISEMSHDYVKHPADVVKVGDDVQVQVLGFSKKKRRIDLSMKALMEKPESTQPVMAMVREEPESFFDDEDGEETPTAMEIALRRAMGSDYQPDFRKKGKGKRRRERRRRQQEDILNRTLQSTSE